MELSRSGYLEFGADRNIECWAEEGASRYQNIPSS